MPETRKKNVLTIRLLSSLKRFQYQDTAVCMRIILALVMAADFFSSSLRAKILD